MNNDNQGYAIQAPSGNIVCHSFRDGGSAIDYIVLKYIQKDKPTKKEKRAKWLSMSKNGYKLLTPINSNKETTSDK